MARMGRGKVWGRGDAAHDLAARGLVIGLEGDGNHGNGRCLTRQVFIKESEWPAVHSRRPLIYVAEVMEIIVQVAAVKASVDTTGDHLLNLLRDGPTEADGRGARPCSLFGPRPGRSAGRAAPVPFNDEPAGRDGAASADVPGCGPSDQICSPMPNLPQLPGKIT